MWMRSLAGRQTGSGVLSVERRVRRGPRIEAAGGRSAVPVHAALRVRMALPRMHTEAACAAVTPLGVVAYADDTRRWHRVPVAARGVGGTLIGLAVTAAYHPVGRPRLDKEERSMAEENGRRENAGVPAGAARTTAHSSGFDEQMVTAIGRASGAEAIAGAMAAAARPEAAVGPSTSSGEHTVIPLTETFFYGG